MSEKRFTKPVFEVILLHEDILTDSANFTASCSGGVSCDGFDGMNSWYCGWFCDNKQGVAGWICSAFDWSHCNTSFRCETVS